jgi:1-aminocyclopropane-1-carboxylate deaminase
MLPYLDAIPAASIKSVDPIYFSFIFRHENIKLSIIKMLNINEAPVESLYLKELSEKNIKADVLRLDKIHDVISGNKWFKLKYYLEEALVNNFKTLLTFGGAYSNHIIATACTAKMFGLKSIGIIRGGEPAELSHTLLDAKRYGMQLEFISRDEYKRKNEKDFLARLKIKFPDCFIIPEGGAGIPGIKGSSEILDGIDRNNYSHILCAVGTGTMSAGIVNASLPQQEIIGVCILKGMKNIQDEINELTDHPKKHTNFNIIHDYHFGGYAKKNAVLLSFMNSFFRQTAIPSDFVYTGKLFYAALDLIKKDFFSPGNRLLIIHSGGLQGNKSLPNGTFAF